ncbi:MAG: DNA mismatch repair endonuclease MutL [Pseudomonadota bacterium]|nr:DNA mismatch repair endonuclease MutL [Pseudomonadota bacterium]
MNSDQHNMLFFRPDEAALSSPIVKLNDSCINKISAGEVVERPAAVVKELIENSLDALANKIEVSFANGGKTFIKVADDGWGIRKEQLKLSLDSHATSKFREGDLENISTLGFRGEALPSIAAISKLRLCSISRDTDQAYEINSEAGILEDFKPASRRIGTLVEVQDIFKNTPARLKFLKSDKVEGKAIFDIVRTIALAYPEVSFSLFDVTVPERRKVLLEVSSEDDEEKLYKRLKQVLGKRFSETCMRLSEETENYKLYGYSSLPTNAISTPINQYFFVNRRPLRDRQLIGWLRSAYYDFVPRDRHASAVLCLTCNKSLVDINVHPMKSEVRFEEPSKIRSLLHSAIKRALSENGLKRNRVLGYKAINSFKSTGGNSYFSNSMKAQPQNGLDMVLNTTETNQIDFNGSSQEWISGRVDDLEGSLEVPPESNILGVAKAQIHENYLISQTKHGLAIIDQHAAHERLVYEKLKQDWKEKRTEAQTLLIPEIVELNEIDKDLVLNFSDEMKRIGFEIESFGEGTICVRSIPAILTNDNLAELMRDVVQELIDHGTTEKLDSVIDALISKVSCYGSIRSGRRLNSQEMNRLLRDMEANPLSAQCNHGRPTFIELGLDEIEKLFGRR